jgi:hypothetical protein
MQIIIHSFIFSKNRRDAPQTETRTVVETSAANKNQLSQRRRQKLGFRGFTLTALNDFQSLEDLTPASSQQPLIRHVTF